MKKPPHSSPIELAPLFWSTGPIEVAGVPVIPGLRRGGRPKGKHMTTIRYIASPKITKIAKIMKIIFGLK